jgi:NAD+ kinase
VVVNRSKPGAREIGERMRSIGRRHSDEVRLTEEHPLPEGFLSGCEVACVIGGDGTFLGVVPEAYRHGAKVLGVNLGKLGFLATFSPEGIAREFGEILAGEYELEDRMLLAATDPEGRRRFCLNDAVIKQTLSSRLMMLEVFADGDFVNGFACDGLIFATPTGSTAYNLSAGGPIVHPDVRGITLTPICPHTLSNRTVILPTEMTIEVRPDAESREPQVTLDGQLSFGDGGAFPLVIRKAEKPLEMVHGRGYSHFRTLRSKLGWRENAL